MSGDAAQTGPPDWLVTQAIARYGADRALELMPRLAEVAHWISLVEERPLELLDEEPDDGR